ncbi:MAG: lamin tail domain-containing protein [Patescibacteria group bacterium]|nr:lamin tail domain-containing protein [Patescibacteria group bacterium]
MAKVFKNLTLKLFALVIVLALPGVQLTQAYFTTSNTISGNSVSTGLWEKPQLISPADDYLATPGSDWLNNPAMDWSYSLEGNPNLTVQFYYEATHTKTYTADEHFQSPINAIDQLTQSYLAIQNLPDGVYFWHVRALVNGTSWSPWSDTWKLTVDSSADQETSSTPTPTPGDNPADNPDQINPGDVVINEIMWMGSSVSTADEWIELRNTTDHDIDIGQWTIDNAKHSGNDQIQIPASKTISAQGFFLIANNPETSINTALSVSVDVVNNSLELLNSDNGNLILKDQNNQVIDQALGTPDWAAGLNQTGTSPLHQSMERNDSPGDGLLTNSWHTCSSAGCTSTTFWDGPNTQNYGTPGSANLSANDPTAPDYLPVTGSNTPDQQDNPTEASTSAQTQPDPSPTPEPSPQPTPTPEILPTPTPELENPSPSSAETPST